ncbi:transcription initiation factor IID, 18kD subunit-domain-containing protein [Sordaria brevicollis]|uniref:Transcription initiation factor IID, 18kD subunit-domain-containing protein n=1 Tax=Sordaria brevicollis TaxID=83679 RepID=A0AAE0PFG1_SORBR|nr:transcription initiation factor IID, 18kD subunit-domain-containing protein [Sordaria brevicollis]
MPEADIDPVHGSRRMRDPSPERDGEEATFSPGGSYESRLDDLSRGYSRSATEEPNHFLPSKCPTPNLPSEGPFLPATHLTTLCDSSGSETQQTNPSVASKQTMENIADAQTTSEQVQNTSGSEPQKVAPRDHADPTSPLLAEVTAQSQNKDRNPETECPSSDTCIDDAVGTFLSSCGPSGNKTRTISSPQAWFSAQDGTPRPMDVDMEPEGIPKESSSPVPEHKELEKSSGPGTQSDDDLMDPEWDDWIDDEIIIPSASIQQDTVLKETPASSSFPTSFSSVNQVGGGTDLFQDAFDNALDEISTEKRTKRPNYPIPNDIVFHPSGVDTERRGIQDFVGPYPKDPLEFYWKTRAETKEQFILRFTNNIRQMMYVSGETGEPSVETTSIIEDIVRQQVISMLKNCTELAARRGSRSITINDLIFQIRDDAPKVSRLRTFLSWKDVRKNVKDSEDKGGDADIGAAGEDPSAAAGIVPGAGPVDDAAKKNKKAKVGLPWEPSSFYSVEVPEREDEEDEEEEEMNYITLQRLRKADERTKAMTREEYVTWSEFRQASFTYRKGKRFREWAGFGQVTDSKPSDDIVDILGFLTFEMVQSITEEALKIKDHEDLLKERTGENTTNGNSKKRKLPKGLFDPPGEGRTPVEPRHIHEAFRRLQDPSKKRRAMLNGTRLQPKTDLLII